MKRTWKRQCKVVFLVALDLNSKLKRACRIFGPPATFFIDRQGVIRDVVLGPVTRSARDAVMHADAAKSALEKER
jgi:hypothetical protein